MEDGTAQLKEGVVSATITGARNIGNARARVSGYISDVATERKKGMAPTMLCLSSLLVVLRCGRGGCQRPTPGAKRKMKAQL
jgi:hypothetical protein